MRRTKRSRPSPSRKGSGVFFGHGLCHENQPLPEKDSRPRVNPRKHHSRAVRRAVAALELALILPMLVFVFVIAVDWARVFYYSVALTNAARQGAIYGANLNATAQSPYTSVQQAALAEASGLTPQPTVTSTNGLDAAGTPYIEVTVAWQFSTVTSFPGVPSPVNLTRKVRMQVAPLVPY
jgi:Flp pilus assembly protein TadG